ncbi:MAG: hypothetical protein RR336_11430, partial [Oscillospiraceae bacterium]
TGGECNPATGENTTGGECNPATGENTANGGNNPTGGGNTAHGRGTTGNTTGGETAHPGECRTDQLQRGNRMAKP